MKVQKSKFDQKWKLIEGSPLNGLAYWVSTT